MEIAPVTLILVGVISIILGFLASSLLNTLQDEEPEPVQDKDAAPPGGRKGRYTPIVRLWRERSKGGLVVEIDGKSLVDASPLTASQREQLEAAARDFRTFLGMGLTQAGQASVQPVTGPEQQKVSEETAVASATSVWATGGAAIEADSRKALGQESASQTTRPAGPTESGLAVKRPTVKPPVEKPGDDQKPLIIRSRSIVMQIEDVLQDMLSGSPLESRDVHLLEDPDRGVIVTIGASSYEGIEAVPDPEVKAVIRAAVAAWEQAQ